jgi:ribosomal protein S18 acetylase RimI-like enzyme
MQVLNTATLTQKAPAADAAGITAGAASQVRDILEEIRRGGGGFDVLHENITRLERLVFESGDDEAGAQAAMRELTPWEVSALNDAYCAWETEVEFRFSRAVLAGEETDLRRYLLSDRFDTLIRRELALLSGPPPQRILFIGSGPLPISAYYLHRLTGKRVDCLDRDPAAVAVSRQLIETLGLGDALHVFNGEGESFHISDYDLIVVALLAKPKRRILRNLRKKAAPGCRILCRTSYGLRRLVYEPTSEDVLLGLDVRGKQVAHGEQTISTLLLRGTAHVASDVRLRWVDHIDQRMADGILCLMNRVLARETTIGFPGPLDPPAGNILLSQLDADVAAGRRHVLIAEQGDLVVGQVIISPHHLPNCKHLVELSRGIIDPAYRGAGLALNAFQEIASKCEEIGGEVIYLDVRAGTLAAELWKSFGFVPFGQLPDYARVNGRRYHGLFMSQTVASLRQNLEEKMRGRQRAAETAPLAPAPHVFSPYSKRRVRSLPRFEFDDWRLKVYGITAEGRHLDPALVNAARAAARLLLPKPGVAAPLRYGAGFLIAHAGLDADFVVVGWWGAQNELLLRVLTSPPGQTRCLEERTNADGSVACVWDMAVLWAEREAWVTHVLRPEGADFEGYLTATLEGEI